ncbi:helix-turn-helix domain-containing protein [Actinophytocola sp.]|uniref:helix-turn-helix domain-containing protein n=1 Tax=Actinophytocola sp. TaxID=1872138 RepID=UPI002D7FC32A|nr:helix-turn-helix domain-containing protein [Actinophytocola sp.]HET9143907.1 helix-turn-helix domain-containing protein [Actinophytocola sp.]
MTAPRPNPTRERHWICAQRLRDRRLALGLTQREVVARLQRRGQQTTNRALSAMENGRGLDLGLLPELADSLRCTTTYLLGLTTRPQSWQPDGLTPDKAEPDRPAAPPATLSGILGPHLPANFAAPGRFRRR